MAFSNMLILTLVIVVAALQCSFGAPPPPPKPAAVVSNSGPYKCPRADGMFGHPKTCRKFYMCAENHPYLQSCPPGLYFDAVKKHCMHKHKDIKCGPQPLTELVTTTVDPLTASKCDEAKCQLPDCWCSKDGTRVPGNLDPEDIPQMVVISFDGAINANNIDGYKSIINATRKNPNGCNPSFTFFVSHQYSSYQNIEQMANQGHEIALNGVYGREPETWWETATKEEWERQMMDLKEMLVSFGNVTKSQIVGMRSPFLRNGGNEMAQMLVDQKMLYDASLPAATTVPMWPYTFDYRMPHRCVGGTTCPTHSFKGLWEFPLNMMYSEDGTGGSCALADQCVFQEDEDLIFEFLEENFKRHYKSNRAPLGLYFHSNWFQIKEKVSALKRFIAKAQTYKGVHFVSIKRALDWVRDPQPMSREAQPAFDCSALHRHHVCNEATTCVLNFAQEDIEETRYMQTCATCPRRYPWIGNPKGLVRPQDKVVVDEEPEDFDTENERNSFIPSEEY